MGRRNNYSFEKQQKENRRKKKQAEKLERKRLKKEGGAPDEAPATPGTTEAIPVTGETPAETTG